MDKKSRNKVKLLLGPRQSGKSTLLRHCLGADKGIMTINLQDRRERIKYERNKDAFLQELEASPGTNTVIIDEIQRVPGLLDDIQYFFDKPDNRFNFFLTGSSGRKLKTDSSNLLPGRTHIFRMTPVLQAEQREAEILPLPMKSGLKLHREAARKGYLVCRVDKPRKLSEDIIALPWNRF